MDKRDQPYPLSIDLHNVERVIAEPVKYRNGHPAFYTRVITVLTAGGRQKITLYADNADALSIEEPQGEDH